MSIQDELSPYLTQEIAGVRDLPLDVVLPRVLHILEVIDRALEDRHLSVADFFTVGRALIAAAHEARQERERRRPPAELARDPVETVTDVGLVYPPAQPPGQ